MLSILAHAASQFSAQPFLFDRITTADGLAGDEVFALLEDRQGCFWIGTSTGLSHWEGTRFRNYFHDPGDSTTLGHDQVNSIAEDARGSFWLATMNGLSCFDPQQGAFRTYRIPATGARTVQANRLRQVVAIGDSLVWTLTEDGLFRFDARTKQFRSMQGLPPGEGPAGFCRARNAMHWDATYQVLWVATREGLAAWNARTGAWSDHRSQDLRGPWSEIQEVTAPIVRDDTLWYFSDGDHALHAFSLRTGTSMPPARIVADGEPFSLQWQAFDADGTQWAATWTRRSFFRSRGDEWRELTPLRDEPGGMPSTNSPHFALARNGDRWFATTEGIAVLRASAQATTLMRQHTGGLTITCLLPLGGDSLLAGTTHGTWLLNESGRQEQARHLTRKGASEPISANMNFLRGMFRCSDARVALCTGHGVALLDLVGWSTDEDDRLTRLFGRNTSPAFTFMAEADGACWFGTWQRGLWRCPMEPEGLCSLVDTTDGRYGILPNRSPLCWFTDSKGRHWIGLNNGGGLALLENGRWRSVRDQHGAHVGGVVRVIAESPTGELWLGTHEQGIVVFDPATQRTRYVTRHDGVPGARIMAQHFARDGTLWVVGDQGIARMPRGARAFVPFPLPAGLRERSAANAMTELNDGRLLFAVKDRIVVHDPDLHSAAPQPPAALITGHRVSDAACLGAPPPLELSAVRKALSLDLGATGVLPGDALLFRYRIGSIDTAWKNIGDAERIDLFDLPGGAHVIEVGASSDGIRWSTSPVRVQVRVLPHWYANWWFRVLVMLGIAALVLLGFHRALGRRLRLQREAFEREQAVLSERMRIAGDMHDDLGAGLSGLKLRSEMALRVEQDPVKRAQLSSMASAAGELIGSMRQIIWAMNADQGSVADWVSYTANYVRQYAEANSLRIEVDAGMSWPEQQLSSEQRRNAFLVVKEAMHNAVKHASATQVSFIVKTVDDTLQVTVIDDGIGLPANVDAAIGNGLRNMRRRAAELGGELIVGPARGGSGAHIVLVLPISRTPNLGSIAGARSYKDFSAP